MQLCIVAHDVHFDQPANSQRLPFKNNNISNEKYTHLMFKLSSSADSLCQSLFNFFWWAPQLPARLLYF